MNKKPKAIICDLDGTLCNIDHRRHFVDPYRNEEIWQPYRNSGHIIPSEKVCKSWRYKSDLQKEWHPDYAAFEGAMKGDTPNEWCFTLVEAMWEKSFATIFVTGREQKYERAFHEWLMNQGHDKQKWVYAPIFMRPDGFQGSDVELKRCIYQEHIEGKYDVLFAIDDRTKLVNLWRSLGIVCLDCAAYGA